MNEWKLTYKGFDPEQEPLREALCTLSNGYFATRGAAEESVADGTHYPGTYLAGGYNRLKSDIAERVIENEDLVNWPNWLCLTFKVEGENEWFRPEQTKILHYEQTLDLKKGLLKREMRISDDAKRETSLTSIRAVSMDNPHFAMIAWHLKAENWSGRIVLRTSLDGAVKNEGVERYKKLSSKHLNIIEKGKSGEDSIYLLAQTSQSHLYMAQASRCQIFQDNAQLTIERSTIEEDERIIQDLSFEIQQHKHVEIEKIVALYSSADHAIAEALTEARDTLNLAARFDVLLNDHQRAWEKIWNRFNLEINARGNTQMLLRLHIFHLLQTCSMHMIDLDVGVPARGWHGEAYRGHIFWDELFILPFFNLHMSDLTKALLLYRYRRLRKAREAAKAIGLTGAMFPWQSGSNGREENQVLHLNPQSGKWVSDDTYLQRHVNVAIAYNIWQYYVVTEDLHFMRFYGAEMFLEIALFLSSITTFNNSKQRFEIKGVVGPDEFHTAYPGAETPGINNNAYTNLMAVWVFIHALKVLKLLDDFRRKEFLEKLSITDEDLARWDEISRKMFIPFHEKTIISQFEGYENLQELDWEHYRKQYGNIKRLDRILDAEGDSVNRYKVSKQADVLMLFYLFSAEKLSDIFQRLGYAFNPATIPDNIQYYIKRTSDGSTLSRIVRSWVEARLDRECSWHCFEEALNSDFKDVQGGTTSEGIHLGSMGGTVDIIQRCFTGIEMRDNVLWFNPALPAELNSMKFRISFRGHWLNFYTDRQQCKIILEDGVTDTVKIGFIDQIYELLKDKEKVFGIKENIQMK